MPGIKYITRVLRGVRFEKLNYVMGVVKQKSGHSKARTFCDILWCAARYGAGYYDYVMFGFYAMNGRQRDTYLTRVRNKKVCELMNQPGYGDEFDDKLRFNVRFADLSGRGEQSMVDLQLFASEGGDAASPSAPALSHAQAQQAIASGTMKADEGREASDVPTPAAVQEPEERPAPPERPAPLQLPPIPGLREGANTVRALHARWAAEEAMLRRDMPDFSLKQELANPEMRRLMELPGMRMGDAYRLAHYNDALRQTAQTVEQGVVERIRQRSARPAENGTSPGGAAITRADVASMTRAQREALERRAMHGVKISF